MYETRFRDRGIDCLCIKRVSEIGAFDGLCMKHVSEIGVLIVCDETCFRDRGIDLGLSPLSSLFSPFLP